MVSHGSVNVQKKKYYFTSRYNWLIWSFLFSWGRDTDAAIEDEDINADINVSKFLSVLLICWLFWTRKSDFSNNLSSPAKFWQNPASIAIQ